MPHANLKRLFFWYFPSVFERFHTFSSNEQEQYFLKLDPVNNGTEILEYFSVISMLIFLFLGSLIQFYTSSAEISWIHNDLNPRRNKFTFLLSKWKPEPREEVAIFLNWNLNYARQCTLLNQTSIGIVLTQ